MPLKPLSFCRLTCPTSYSRIQSPPVSIRSFTSLTTSRRLEATSILQVPSHRVPSRIRNSSVATKMSFSNTETPADKPADPYTAKNKSEPELKEKVDDLVSFITSCKFAMMTTRIESSGLLVSRCMALAAKVSYEGSPLED